jgi:small subunit ribosomal protein S16
MPVKIRLQRHGKKGQPFYHIVVADGRAPRDGRFIERIGSYNPLTSPATIDLDVENAVRWLRNGAQPTETARTILRFKGALYLYHLLKGVTKGALTEEQARAKFDAWVAEKEVEIRSAANNVELKKKEELKKRRDAEVRIRDARAEEIAEKRRKEVEKLVAEVQAETAAPAAAAAVAVVVEAETTVEAEAVVEAEAAVEAETETKKTIEAETSAEAVETPAEE